MNVTALLDPEIGAALASIKLTNGTLSDDTLPGIRAALPTAPVWGFCHG